MQLLTFTEWVRWNTLTSDILDRGCRLVHTKCLIGATVYGTIGGSLQLMSIAGHLVLC